MNPDDAINATGLRITMLRGEEMRKPRPHTCRKKDCLPMCERDLVNDGRLPRNAKIYDERVYLCIYHQVHVCCPDRCPSGVCPVTGRYHGNSGPGSIRDEKLENPSQGLNVLKRATHVPPQPLTEDESRFLAPKYRKLEEDGRVRIKIEPGLDDEPPMARTITSTLPESGFYSFGSAVVKKKKEYNKHSKRGGAGGGGVAGRKKAIPSSKRRDDAEVNPRGSRYRLAHPVGILCPSQIIVTQLLYSPVRKAINNQKKSRLAENKLKALTTYYKDRAGITFPIMVEVEGIKAIYDVDVPTLRDLKRDEARINHYVNIILRTWDIVTR